MFKWVIHLIMGMLSQQTSCNIFGLSFSKVRVTWNRNTGYESKKQHIKYCGSQSHKHNVWIKVFWRIFKNTEESNIKRKKPNHIPLVICPQRIYFMLFPETFKCASLMTLFFSIYFCWYLLQLQKINLNIAVLKELSFT